MILTRGIGVGGPLVTAGLGYGYLPEEPVPPPIPEQAPAARRGGPASATLGIRPWNIGPNIDRINDERDAREIVEMFMLWRAK